MTIKQRFINREDYGMILFYFGADELLKLAKEYENLSQFDKIEKMVKVIEGSNRFSSLIKQLTDEYLIPFIKNDYPELNTEIIKYNPELIELKRAEILTNRLNKLAYGTK